MLAIWKLHDLIFPEKSSMGKKLVKKIIELKLTKAFYRDFLYDIINKEKEPQKRKAIDMWINSEYESWLSKKAETGELSDIIITKE